MFAALTVQCFLQNFCCYCKTPFFRVKCYANIITIFLLAKLIFLSVPCIQYKLMKPNFVICLALLFSSSWWEQHLGKSYDLRWQNGAMISDYFAFKKTKSCRQHALLELRLRLLTKVPLWLHGVGQIIIDQK